MLILWVPGGFRVTCYYYRKAYYRAFFLDPPACAVGEAAARLPRRNAAVSVPEPAPLLPVPGAGVPGDPGDRRGPLHCRWPGRISASAWARWCWLANVTLLALYTFSCHSLRHLVGGNVDCFSCVAMGQARYRLWTGVSVLNRNHMLWAWVSLFMVGFADFYVWMVASGPLDRLCGIV